MGNRTSTNRLHTFFSIFRYTIDAVTLDEPELQ